MIRGLVQGTKIVQLMVPQDIDGAAMDGASAATGDAVCMKNYGHVTIILSTGLTPDARTVTLKQSTSAALGSEKALGFTTNWVNEGLSTDLLTKTTVTSNTFDTAATANNMYVMEVDAEDLDMANSFDWVRLDIATGDTSATIISAIAILSEPKFAAGAAGMPTAIA